MNNFYFVGFNYHEKMKSLREQALNHGLDSFNERHLDNAFHAISLKELDHVIENTTSRLVQDYAMVKRNYYFEIKGMRE